MDDRPFAGVTANAVLRGGPLDGAQVHVYRREPIGIEVEAERYVYRPTVELDDEFPTLAVWVFDHSEPA